VGAAGRAARRWLDRVFLWTGYFAGALFFGLAFFVTYDVLARTWGSAVGLPTTRVTDEISGYILVLAATWGLAYTLRTDAHVRIDVLLPHMPPRLRALADRIAWLVMAGFAALFAWRIWILVQDSWETGIRSSTYLLMPLWVPQVILGVGFSLLALAAAVSVVTDLVGPRPEP
jgi:TRAP-type C4-dicarboxylate transport system permease small subunit